MGRAFGVKTMDKLKQAKLMGDPGCDWHEDTTHENGNYFCKCVECKSDFVGHKRRHFCRKCHYESKARYDAMTPEEREVFDERRNAEIVEFFRASSLEHSPH
jgi:hypothetical protein